MSGPLWCSTWTRMRNLSPTRKWMTAKELVAEVMARVPDVTEWRVQMIVRSMPKPPSRHAMHQYTEEHLAAVVAKVEEFVQGGSDDAGIRTEAAVG